VPTQHFPLGKGDQEFKLRFQMFRLKQEHSLQYTHPFQPVPHRGKTRHLSHCKKTTFFYLEGTDYLPYSGRAGKKKCPCCQSVSEQDRGDAEFNTM